MEENLKNMVANYYQGKVSYYETVSLICSGGFKVGQIDMAYRLLIKGFNWVAGGNGGLEYDEATLRFNLIPADEIHLAI